MTGRDPEAEQVLLQVRKIAAYVFTGLVVFLLIADRVGPIISPDYEPLGDAALGLVLGALTVLIVGQSIDWLRR